MKIAIHDSESGFHPRWVAYCEENNILYKRVNCHANNIIAQLKGCDALMWHHHHMNAKDVLSSKKILFALEHAGVKVFPNFKTAWHFDDKVAQKYLLESLGLPLVPSYVFYNKKDAFLWANKTSYPKVFKLRGGAGASNVSLVKNKKQAKSIIKKAFRNGFKQYNPILYLKERIRNYKAGRNSLVDILKGIVRLFFLPRYVAIMGKEIGYVYFQDFIANNDSDYRVIIVNNKAFAIKRMVRKNDFRASGSGSFHYNENLFDSKLIKTAFEANKLIKSDCIAFDFVYYKEKPLIVEISYGFANSGYDKCPGYWDKEFNFFKQKFDPYNWMVENIIQSVKIDDKV